MNGNKEHGTAVGSSRPDWRPGGRQIFRRLVSALGFKSSRSLRAAAGGAWAAAGWFLGAGAAQAQNTNAYLPFEGLCYSPFRTGENPNLPIYPTLSEINADLTNIVKYLAPEIRTYGMSGTLSNIPALCCSNNLNCYPCAYISLGYTTVNGAAICTALGASTNEMNALIAVGNANYPTTKGLIVGNESILNTEDPNMVAALIGCINQVRTNLNGNVKTPVTTAETWDDVYRWPTLVSNLDFIMIHVDPIWYGQAITNAVNYVLTQYEVITNAYPGKRVVVGETGWPGGGTFSDPAEPGVASLVNQTAFLLELNARLKTNHLECLVFEPFDELWKDAANTNDIEDNWGLYYANRTMKPSLSNYLSQNLTLSLNTPPKARGVNVTIGTYAGNPYGLYESSNLAEGWTPNPPTHFTGAWGTNQTTLEVTNNGGNAWFFRAVQGF